MSISKVLETIEQQYCKDNNLGTEGWSRLCRIVTTMEGLGARIDIVFDDLGKMKIKMRYQNEKTKGPIVLEYQSFMAAMDNITKMLRDISSVIKTTNNAIESVRDDQSIINLSPAAKHLLLKLLENDGVDTLSLQPDTRHELADAGLTLTDPRSTFINQRGRLVASLIQYENKQSSTIKV